MSLSTYSVPGAGIGVTHLLGAETLGAGVVGLDIGALDLVSGTVTVGRGSGVCTTGCNLWSRICCSKSL